MASEQAKIKIHLGEPLPSWQRRVLFFSNLHSIFYGNVEETRQLMSEVYGAHSYGGRVISILDLLFGNRPNLIMLEVAPDGALINYLSRDLGLSLPNHEILDVPTYDAIAAAHRADPWAMKNSLCDKLREHPAEWVDGFVTDEKLVRIAELLGKRTVSSLDGSKNGNNKYLLYRYQMEQNLPVFDTLIAADQAELQAALVSLRVAGYRHAVVKAQIGASGYGMNIVALDGTEHAAIPDFLFFEGPCMVQGWIEDTVLGMRKLASPSVQLFLNDDTVFLFDTTEQILSEQSVHQGNLSPPPVAQQFPDIGREMLRQAGLAGIWLHRQGYRGTGSVDFLIVDRAGRRETILCEINARITGATYPSLLARHFRPTGSWLMRNISFRKPLEGVEIIALIARAGVLYRPGLGRGIIPFNFNSDTEGKVLKGQFVSLADQIDDCSQLLNLAWSCLPVEWGYDRD